MTGHSMEALFEEEQENPKKEMEVRMTVSQTMTLGQTMTMRLTKTLSQTNMMRIQSNPSRDHVTRIGMRSRYEYA